MWFKVKVRPTSQLVSRLFNWQLNITSHITQRTLFARRNRLSTEKNCLNFVFIRVGWWCVVLLCCFTVTLQIQIVDRSPNNVVHTHMYVSGESNSIPESLTFAQLLCVTYVYVRVWLCIWEMRKWTRVNKRWETETERDQGTRHKAKNIIESLRRTIHTPTNRRTHNTKTNDHKFN